MYLRTRPRTAGRLWMASRLWHVALLAIVAAALVTQIVLVCTGGADANSARGADDAGTATRLVRLFSYFTVQSNLLVMVSSLSLFLAPQRDGRLWRVLRLDTLLGIAITGLVFAVVLAPDIHLTGAALWVTIGFHYFAPPATLVGWLLFGPRDRIDRTTVARSFLWPAAWIGYTLLHGAVTHWYPYPFLDAGELGYAVALRNILFVLLIALAAALALARLDRVLTRRAAHRERLAP
ncbi:Pr6Pr family membrane protein [Streptomyces longisporoflavus]|uniref:Pr6Pr family membrane protein n=1 Tax=Streptomyces longisporoflavus TaxID=28044 RepID=A0ABW7QQE9_9ACTN